MSTPTSDTRGIEATVAAVRSELRALGAHAERTPAGMPSLNTPADLPKLDALRLVGLSFSGGGIRSATFSLGVIQTLERVGLLKYVDYLSTVSGGGYIGSWYVACLKRDQITEEDRDHAVGHLRKYSRYLAPEGGLFSADSWTIASIWIRNTLLLQTMLVCLFALLLLTQRIVTWAFLTAPLGLLPPALAAAFALSVVVIVASLNRSERPNAIHQGWVQLFVVMPALAGATCLAALFWRLKTERVSVALLGSLDRFDVLWLSGGIVVLGTCATAWASLLPGRRTWKSWFGVPVNGLLCGGLLVGLGWVVMTQLFDRWVPFFAGPWLAALIGSPAMLMALSLCVVLQIGLLGRTIGDGAREWWGRLGAFLAIYSLGPLALGLVAIFGPQLAAMLTSESAWEQWLGGSVTVGGIITTLGGVLAARSHETGNGGTSVAKETLAAAAPYLFIAGLLVATSTGLHHILRNAPACELYQGHWVALNCSIAGGIDWLWYSLLGGAALLGLFAYRIDINEASMNPFYRNRLVRCYLGASRTVRMPDAFTGFDPNDDFGLSTLRPEEGYSGPVPIISTALNLAGGGDAGLQERRATSFFFTPHTTGSAETGVIDTTTIGRYNDGIRTGACVATSGAAASPNMGYHTSAPIAFLMTFFNVRLGMWIRNPLAGEGKHHARWGFYYLLKELFATAGAGNKYIYLSDGGHFENLGVYELVRRRCRYIIVCDAEADGDMVLQGLGGAVRKCRIDFDVEIDIDTTEIQARDERGRSRAHCAVGRINYPPDPATGAAAEPGYLLYLKSSITGDEDSDVLQYRAEHAAFPHESTLDQFFSESQFESYRGLGEHVAEKALWPVSRAGAVTIGRRDDIEEWMQKLDRSWTAVSPFTEGNFARHAEALAAVWTAVRDDDDLAFLDAELFPGWSQALATIAAPGPEERRKGLYLCQGLIQLMENVYLDLRLETTFDHPDNKGWKELFVDWAKSPLLKETYRHSREAYGVRFQEFCQRELGLD